MWGNRMNTFEDDGEKKRSAARTAAIPHTEEDGLNQDVLKKIFDKMDAQFLEIKETLYVRAHTGVFIFY